MRLSAATHRRLFSALLIVGVTLGMLLTLAAVTGTRPRGIRGRRQETTDTRLLGQEALCGSGDGLEIDHGSDFRDEVLKWSSGSSSWEDWRTKKEESTDDDDDDNDASDCGGGSPCSIGRYDKEGHHHHKKKHHHHHDNDDDDDDDSDDSHKHKHKHKHHKKKKGSSSKSGPTSIQSNIVANLSGVSIGNTITIINVSSGGGSASAAIEPISKVITNANPFVVNGAGRSAITSAAVRAFCASTDCNQYNVSPPMVIGSGSAIFAQNSSISGSFGAAGSEAGSVEITRVNAASTVGIGASGWLLLLSVATQFGFV